MENHIFPHDSISAWVAAGNGKNPRGRSMTREADQRWDLDLGWDGWLDIARNGWAEGVEKIRKLSEGITVPDELLESIQLVPERVLAESGDEVEVGLMLTGEVECMQDWIPAERQEQSKIVKLGLNLRLTADENCRLLLHRAVAALAIADVLEQAGYAVEICAASIQSYGGSWRGVSEDKFIFECLAKHSDQQLDIADLSCVAHPAFKRRGWFAIGEQCAHDTVSRNCQEGHTYGSSKNSYPNPDGDILVIEDDWHSAEVIQPGVEKLLKDFFKV